MTHPDPFDLDDHRPRRETELDAFLAAGVREAEQTPIATTCHACEGCGLDEESDEDGPLPCHWCGGNGLEYETSLIVEGQASS